MKSSNDRSNILEDNILNSVAFDYDAVEKSFCALPKSVENKLTISHVIIQMLFFAHSLSRNELEILVNRLIELKSWAQISRDLDITKWRATKTYEIALKKIKNSPLYIELKFELDNMD